MKLQSVILLVFVTIKSASANAQSTQIIAGPMLGQVELRTAQVWLQVSSTVKSVSASLYKNGGSAIINKVTYAGPLQQQFNYVKLWFTNLEPGTTYQYQFSVNGSPVPNTKARFTTQALWHWRTPPPDFSFLTGSCAYFNEAVYDRPDKPYGGDSSIFTTMAAEKNTAFMLWLGDNWYTREADYFSEWGLNMRATHDRSLPVLQPFLKAMAHYAIWDDHDYGPNDAGESYIFKEASRNVFMNTWCNPSFGQNGQGIYSKFTYNDVDFFMLDDRWNRSNDHTPDSINGQVNLQKTMFGKQQLDWLKNELRFSNANTNIHFKIIVTGSQVLNPVSPFDCLRHFSAEYNELMDFLAGEKIEGVVFLTGDRHLSEVVKKERAGLYPLYDVTSSPLTSGSTKFSPVEKNSAAIVLGIDEKQNYTKVEVTGAGNDRTLSCKFIGVQGEALGQWKVTYKELINR